MPRLTAGADDPRAADRGLPARRGAGETDYFESRRAQQLLGQTHERGLAVDGHVERRTRDFAGGSTLRSSRADEILKSNRRLHR